VDKSASIRDSEARRGSTSTIDNRKVAMELIDALIDNANSLVIKTSELRARIDTLQGAGHPATATIDELVMTCAEIGRLNDAIKKVCLRAGSKRE